MKYCTNCGIGENDASFRYSPIRCDQCHIKYFGLTASTFYTLAIEAVDRIEQSRILVKNIDHYGELVKKTMTSLHINNIIGDDSILKSNLPEKYTWTTQFLNNPEKSSHINDIIIDDTQE